MAYNSKYTGAELEKKLDAINDIPKLIDSILLNKDYVTEEALKCFMKDYAPSDYSNIPIDNNTIYWENGLLKSKGGTGGGSDNCGCLWELRESKTGGYYLYSKYHVASKYGMSMYIEEATSEDGSGFIPDYVADLPIDNDTIYWSVNSLGNPVLKAKVGTGGSNSEFSKLFKGHYDEDGNLIYIEALSSMIVNGGITIYAGNNTEIDSIYDGLPIDNTTIKWIETTNSDGSITRLLGINPDINLGGASTWDELEGKPSWITTSKPKWDYEVDIYNKPNLSIYATLEYVNDEFKKYVTLDTDQTIKGFKDFEKGLSVGDLSITKSQDDVVYIDANLVVRGGITMYATDAIDVPSIIEALPSASSSVKGIAAFNPNDFSVVDGYVSFIGSSSGVDESVLADYAKKTDLSGYLPLSGGQMTGNIGYTLTPDSYKVGIPSAGYFEYSGSTGLYASLAGYKSFLGSAYNIDSGAFFHVISVRHRNGLSDGYKYGLSIIADLNTTGGDLKWNKHYAGDWMGERVILDSENWSNYIQVQGGGSFISTSGGRITNSTTGLYINRTTAEANPHITFEVNGNRVGDLGIASHGEPAFYSYGMTGSTGWKRILYDGASTFELKDITIQQDKWGNGIALRRTATGGGAGISSYSQDIFLGIFGIGGAGKFEFSNKSNTTVFNVNQSGDVLANGVITMYSDQRKKTILNHVELTLQQIADAPLIEHYYNSDSNKTTHVGSIAQYWVGLNDWFCKLDSEGYYTMEIQNAALASAISIARELSRYESKTDRTIRKLKKRISELEDEVERLKMN